TPSTPTVTSFKPVNAGVAGGAWAVTRTATKLAIGDLNGSTVALFDVTAAPVLLDKTLTSATQMNQICISDF
ncbi:MAG TPA: hypothetical protein VMU01_08035, partial [Rhizomicrobium sp.]|nr:hypothetical protein [Rhizomicrobium sp.]